MAKTRKILNRILYSFLLLLAATLFLFGTTCWYLGFSIHYNEAIKNIESAKHTLTLDICANPQQKAKAGPHASVCDNAQKVMDTSAFSHAFLGVAKEMADGVCQRGSLCSDILLAIVNNVWFGAILCLFFYMVLSYFGVTRYHDWAQEKRYSNLSLPQQCPKKHE